MISSRQLREAVPGLAALPDRTIDRIAALAGERRYAATRVLYRAGDEADGLYFVLAGKVRVSREGGTRARMLHHETPGGVLGEIPVLGGGAFPATAVAAESTRCAHLPLAAVNHLLRDEPDFARWAMRRLAMRARSLLQRIDELTATTVLVRVARHVLRRAETSGTPDFTLGLSQEGLASELDTAREVVVRALAALVDAGAIQRTGRSRFTLVRPTLLRAMAAV
ncbi:MAG: Crp/Fnr family transcriptional regulator [Gemmatimonadaceae bacterium]